MVLDKSLREIEAADFRGKKKREVLCKMISQKEVPTRHACYSLNISKSAYYESLKKPAINMSDRSTKKTIYDISLEYPKYGYRSC